MNLRLSIRPRHTSTLLTIPCLAAGLLAGCDLLPPLDQAVPTGSDGIYDTAATPAVSLASTAYPGPAAYPAPAARLHDTIFELPDGVTPDLDSAWLLDGSNPALVLHAVPLFAPEGPLDIAVVMSDAEGSAATWLFSRDAHVPFETRWTKEVAVWFQEEGVIPAMMVGAEDGSRGLLVWSGISAEEDTPVHMIAWLPLAGADFATGDEMVQLSRTDWSGDGTLDALLAADDGQAAALYLGTDRPAVFRPIARIVSPSQVIDVDGDGAHEIVRRDGDTWRVERWDGLAFVAAEPIPAALPTAAPVTDGSLPPLPAELLFLRGEEIWVWPRVAGPPMVSGTGGNALRRVMADPGAGRADGWQGGKPRLTSFRVGREGGQIAYPLGRFEKSNTPEQYDIEVTELFVFDPATGQTTKVAADIADQGAPNSHASFFDIGPNGDFVVFVGPTLTPDRCLSAISIAPVADPSQAREIGTCGNRAEVSESSFARVAYAGGRCGCDGLLMSPDGRRLAFSDERGLWVADLPDGEARLLAENEEEQQGGVDGIQQPRLWSPDGRYLVSSAGYFEGSGKVLWDVDAGTPQDLKLFEYVGPGWDLAWLPINPRLIAETGGPSPLNVFPPPDTGTSDATRAKPLIQRLWPDMPDDQPVAVGAGGLYAGGGIGFALRQSDTTLYPGNGVFRLGSDGKGLRGLAALPEVEMDEHGRLRYDLAGDVMWSPLGQAFLVLEVDPVAQAQVPALLGSSNGSGVWDVQEVLGDASGFVWGREGSQ